MGNQYYLLSTIAKSVALLLVIATLQSCSTGEKPHEKLNGKWTSDVMTVKIDFDKGTYSGVAMGRRFNDDLKLVEESSEVVVFKADGDKITAQFQPDGGILLTKKAGVSVQMQPAE
jgi:hypothetical protein